MKELFLSIENAVRDAGEIMLNAGRLGVSATEKLGDATNLVTEYDTKTQSFLLERLGEAFPHAEFIAEEKDNDSTQDLPEHCFIIDPIDGTANFVHGYGHSAISVAYLNFGRPAFSAIYNPFSGEMFTAMAGEGAYLNGERISVRKRDIPHAIITFGSSPYYKGKLAEPTFEVLKRLFLRCSDVRRLGSAALDLAYLAAGRCDGFFELMLSPWDFAAGALIVTEAGGVITDDRGNPLNLTAPSPIVAGTADVHGEILSVIRGLN